MAIPLIDFTLGRTSSSGVEVIELSSLYVRDIKDHDPCAPHRLSFFMLVLFEKGVGKHMVDFQEYAYGPGTVVSVQQEQVTAFDLSCKPEGKLLLFTQTYLDNVHANMRLPSYTPIHLNSHYSPVLHLDETNRARTTALMAEIASELNCEEGDPLIVMYLFSALSLLHRRLKTVGEVENLSPSQSRILFRFMTLLQQNFEQIRDANWYADQAAITYKTLNQICKVSTSLTAKQMIDAFTIIEIKRRLVINKVTSQQLAYDFNFDDPSNFVKYFKKETGVTPSEFRKYHNN
ncbi:AraC family transcriptional regulator [Enterovibrio nigricans]|uniref:AraC-type DNA-binding protein n=1 Tax=Enterovibrio nigricans DSM 22720 TaxID=1121868 RepID=A0A1T4VG06_9GAMM|nr:helix-turn-helix domain-containing protein [Enterovibrio nigricans]PKF49749.1 AraC family transcriptional regulator [Enterovibrio nigricans]SKA63833.1 AraC-type DNA-binding protein [Enterovibrio nigricans DSM 22720]